MVSPATSPESAQTSALIDTLRSDVILRYEHGGLTVYVGGETATVKLDAGGAGPVESFLPAMMLAVRFGLSMDYEVFLVSRVHEEWLRTSGNKLAVRLGQAASGRVITAAATIMICVFVAFVFGGQRVIAEFGVGLASAILLDALVVRTILVPAVMQMLGRANWYLPKPVDRILSRLSVEAADARPADLEQAPQVAGSH